MTTTDVAPQPPFAVTPRRPGEPEADLTGFTLIHRALRSGARMLADATSGIADGEPCSRERQRAIVQISLSVLHEITHHHQREDDVLWPVIAAAADGAVDLEPLSDDHTELHEVLERAGVALPLFARDPSTGAPVLAPVLTELADLLDEHITEEEAEVFPVIREHVSAADFAACEKRFQKGSSVGHLFFVLPWVISQCSPEERAAVMADAPGMLKVLLKLSEGRWHRRRAVVLGA